ncbi:LacI family DNA-binding transcriptional regulator [Actinocatenispora rupis]|uniref:LacI family transcriptional regulator n=2 Tax=Actinocatenispora rupis TaxID=519421 RepID=A0A8J3J8Q1_9ACTN|nr:LacI family transcriptional regulator [Actinocatenispora rupis]
MKDVAREAGVSASTVSRVLTGATRVVPAKRAAVERACKKLGYHPDGLAAALRNRSSQSVGILVPDIENPIFPAVIRAAEHELALAAVDVVLCDADNDVAVEARRLDTLLRRRVDGLLVCPVHREHSAPALRAAALRVPTVQLDRYALTDVDFVGTDQDSGMRQVVEHLRDRGARTAVFVGGYRGMSSLTERAQAFERACAEHGIAARPTVDVRFPDADNGRRHARDLLARGGLPDAIACASDELAFGLLVELRAAGVRCPEDVLVTGHDDIPAAGYMELTSVNQSLPDKGREAARLLRHQSSSPRQVRLTPTLVARTSTARPSPAYAAAGPAAEGSHG